MKRTVNQARRKPAGLRIWTAMWALVVVASIAPTCQADIIVPGESYGALFLAISNDANQGANAQSGSLQFGNSSQTMTGTPSAPDIAVTTSQSNHGNGNWMITFNFQTIDSDSFIRPGSMISGDEINAWRMILGTGGIPSDSLEFIRPVDYNSVQGEWFADGSSLAGPFDYTGNFNSDPNSISGFAGLSFPAGGNPGTFDAGSDLGSSGIDEIRLTFNVTAIPEPSSTGFLILIGTLWIASRRRRKVIA